MSIIILILVVGFFCVFPEVISALLHAIWLLFCFCLIGAIVIASVGFLLALVLGVIQ